MERLKKIVGKPRPQPSEAAKLGGAQMETRKQQTYHHLSGKSEGLKARVIENVFLNHRFPSLETISTIENWKQYCPKDKEKIIDIFALKESRFGELPRYKAYLVAWNFDPDVLGACLGNGSEPNTECGNSEISTIQKDCHDAAGVAATELAGRFTAALAKSWEVRKGRSSFRDKKAAVADVIASKESIFGDKSGSGVSLGFVHMAWGSWREHSEGSEESVIKGAVDDLGSYIEMAIKNHRLDEWLGIPMSSLEFYCKRQ